MARMSDAATLLSPSRRRPFTLIVLAGLMFLKAGLIGAAVVRALVEEGVASGSVRVPGVGVEVRETPAAGVILLAIAGILVVSALGLLGNRRAGWLLAMVTTGVFLAVDIVGFVNGSANHVWMVLNIITVFYLNQRDVREGVGVAVADPAGEGTSA